MNTRHADTVAPLNQERFSSSPEFERGLVANLVAARCELLDAPADRALIWWLQKLSHETGLEKLAADLVARFPGRIGTASMLCFGLKPGQVYTAQQAETVRREMRDDETEWEKTGERLSEHAARRAAVLQRIAQGNLLDQQEREWENRQASERASAALAAIGDDDRVTPSPVPSPKNCPAEKFVKRCQAALATLPELLSALCLDPSIVLDEFKPWFFPGLVPALREHLAAAIAARRAAMVLTRIGAEVHATLEYALQCGCLVIIEGNARTGKSHSVKDWCALHPGEARYVQVPSSGTDVEFQREIARAIGVSSALSRKAVELRERNKDALQSGRLMLVLDEAHFLWPQSNRREALPARINWILTVLVNAGVPVALVSTPQFSHAQKIVEKNTGWTSEQFEGRVARRVPLPGRLADADLAAVAKAHLPEGDKESIRLLVLYAKSSRKYLAAIEFAVKHARYLASRAGRKQCALQDIAAAIKPDTAAPAPSKVGTSRCDVQAPHGRPSSSPSDLREAPAPFSRSTRPSNRTPCRAVSSRQSFEATAEALSEGGRAVTITAPAITTD